MGALERNTLLTLLRYAILSNLMLVVSSQSLLANLCPQKCECGLDSRNRVEINCLRGRMMEFPTTKLPPSTEVIRIIPPEGQSNHLTIGRFFKQFKKLEELHIVDSNIPNIGEHSFWGVHSLRVLNLKGNNITQIVDSNFKGLVNLEVLNLADNKIDSFVSAAFQSLVKLRELDLSNNRATKLVERLFYNLHVLEVLNLNGNQLRELNPDVFRDIWRLKDFSCRNCGLKTINPLLYALLPDVRVLDFGRNEFKYLNRDEFASLIRLQELYLDENQISAITDDTFRSARLTILSLSSNRIVRMDRKAFENATVAELDLSGNKFESLDKAMFATLRTNLTRLDLSRNPRLSIHSLMILLSENVLLKRLSLARNEYYDLPLDLFEKQHRLESLNLSGNHLTYIYTHQLTPLPRLRYLDLSHNKFKGMDSDIITFMSRIYNFEDIRLNDNPWACDLCNVIPLMTWVKSYPTSGCDDEFEGSCIRCSSPPGFRGKQIWSLEESILPDCKINLESASILAADQRFGLIIGFIIVLLVLIIATASIIVHTKWRATRYFGQEVNYPEIDTPPIPPEYNPISEKESFGNGFINCNGNQSNNMGNGDSTCSPSDPTSYKNQHVRTNSLASLKLQQKNHSNPYKQ